MPCSECSSGQLLPAHRPKAVQRGDRLAVITDVPVLECASCGEVFYTEEVMVVLDGLLAEMLERELVAIRRYPTGVDR